MNTKIRVNRYGGDNATRKPVRIGIMRGKREFAIFLSDMDAARLAEVIREAHHANRDGEFGQFEERES